MLNKDGYLPCPFCGNEEVGPRMKTSFSIECLKCGATGPDFCETDESERRKWNTRTQTNKLDDSVCSLLEALDEYENVRKQLSRASGESEKRLISMAADSWRLIIDLRSQVLSANTTN